MHIFPLFKHLSRLKKKILYESESFAFLLSKFIAKDFFSYCSISKTGRSLSKLHFPIICQNDFDMTIEIDKLFLNLSELLFFILHLMADAEIFFRNSWKNLCYTRQRYVILAEAVIILHDVANDWWIITFFPISKESILKITGRICQFQNFLLSDAC